MMHCATSTRVTRDVSHLTIANASSLGGCIFFGFAAVDIELLLVSPVCLARSGTLTVD